MDQFFNFYVFQIYSIFEQSANIGSVTLLGPGVCFEQSVYINLVTQGPGVSINDTGPRTEQSTSSVALPGPGVCVYNTGSWTEQSPRTGQSTYNSSVILPVHGVYNNTVSSTGPRTGHNVDTIPTEQSSA